MNLQRVKSSADMQLDGITIDTEWRDKTLAALLLTDKSGHILRIVLENYSVAAFVMGKPETKTVQVVTGTVRGLGTPIREEFEDASSAYDRKRELERMDVLDDLVIAPAEVEVPF